MGLVVVAGSNILRKDSEAEAEVEVEIQVNADILRPSVARWVLGVEVNNAREQASWLEQTERADQ